MPFSNDLLSNPSNMMIVTDSNAYVSYRQELYRRFLGQSRNSRDSRDSGSSVVLTFRVRSRRRRRPVTRDSGVVESIWLFRFSSKKVELRKWNYQSRASDSKRCFSKIFFHCNLTLPHLCTHNDSLGFEDCRLATHQLNSVCSLEDVQLISLTHLPNSFKNNSISGVQPFVVTWQFLGHGPSQDSLRYTRVPWCCKLGNWRNVGNTGSQNLILLSSFKIIT